jgi:DGQHR domain-containing protein
MPGYLKRRAICIHQHAVYPLYQFALTGREILQIADISRISRDDGGKLIGYQRSAVKRHIQDIVAYLNGADVLFPNSIILALSSSVKFLKSRGPAVQDALTTAGTIQIPIPGAGGHKPAWIVDGQQRVLALSLSERGNLPVPVNAFVTDDVAVQRDQFIRVNSARPLPRGLLTELLPAVSTPLPPTLEAKKLPSALCDLLNRDESSPFHGLIRRASMKAEERRDAVVVDTSLVKAIEESLQSPSGCLFPYRNIATGETDVDGIWQVLTTYWTAVKTVFPEAWGKPPTQSRLMHGTGIRAMGRLMDRVMPGIHLSSKDTVAQVVTELKRVAPVCRWTSGVWEEFGALRWDELQNVPRHIRLLSNYLIRIYVQSRSVS